MYEICHTLWLGISLQKAVVANYLEQEIGSKPTIKPHFCRIAVVANILFGTTNRDMGAVCAEYFRSQVMFYGFKYVTALCSKFFFKLE